MNRDQNFRRYSMNIPNVEQERLQGWLTIANAIETGQWTTDNLSKKFCGEWENFLRCATEDLDTLSLVWTEWPAGLPVQIDFSCGQVKTVSAG